MINFTGGIIKIKNTYIPTSNIVGITQGSEGTVMSFARPIIKASGETSHTAKTPISAYSIADAYTKAEGTNGIVDVLA